MLVLQQWIAELGTGRRPLDSTRQVVSNVSKPTAVVYVARWLCFGSDWPAEYRI